MELRYMGFMQAKNIREYIFHRIEFRAQTEVFVVTGDLALFLKHHVGIQDGPVLCLRKLTAEMEAVDSTHPPASRQTLTDRDMFVYAASGGFFAKRKLSPKPRT